MIANSQNEYNILKNKKQTKIQKEKIKISNWGLTNLSSAFSYMGTKPVESERKYKTYYARAQKALSSFTDNAIYRKINAKKRSNTDLILKLGTETVRTSRESMIMFIDSKLRSRKGINVLKCALLGTKFYLNRKAVRFKDKCLVKLKRYESSSLLRAQLIHPLKTGSIRTFMFLLLEQGDFSSITGIMIRSKLISNILPKEEQTGQFDKILNFSHLRIAHTRCGVKWRLEETPNCHS